MKTLTMLSMMAASAMAATSNPCPAQTRPSLPADTPFVLQPGQSYDFESPKSGDAGIFKITVPAALKTYMDQKSAPPMFLYLELADNNGAGTGVKWNACYPEMGTTAVVPEKPCNSSATVGTSSGSLWGKGTDVTGDLTLWYDLATNFAGMPEDALYIYLNPICDTTDGCIKTNEWNVNFAFTHAKVADSTADAFMYWGYDNSLRATETPRSQFVLENNVRTANFKTKVNLNQDEFVYFTGETTAANQPVFVNVRLPTATKGAQLQLLIGNATHIDVAAPAYKFPQFLKNGNWENYEAPFTPVAAGKFQAAIKTVVNDEVSLGGWVKWTIKAGYGERPCDSAATVGASALIFALIPLTWLANRL